MCVEVVVEKYADIVRQLLASDKRALYRNGKARTNSRPALLTLAFDRLLASTGTDTRASQS